MRVWLFSDNFVEFEGEFRNIAVISEFILDRFLKYRVSIFCDYEDNKKKQRYRFILDKFY